MNQFFEYMQNQDWTDWKVADFFFEKWNGTTIQHTLAYDQFLKDRSPEHIHIQQIQTMIEAYYKWYNEQGYTDNWFMLKTSFMENVKQRIYNNKLIKAIDSQSNKS